MQIIEWPDRRGLVVVEVTDEERADLISEARLLTAIYDTVGLTVLMPKVIVEIASNPFNYTTLFYLRVPEHHKRPHEDRQLPLATPKTRQISLE